MGKSSHPKNLDWTKPFIHGGVFFLRSQMRVFAKVHKRYCLEKIKIQTQIFLDIILTAVGHLFYSHADHSDQLLNIKNRKLQ